MRDLVKFKAFTFRGQRYGVWIGINRHQRCLPFMAWAKLNPAGECRVIGWAN